MFKRSLAIVLLLIMLAPTVSADHVRVVNADEDDAGERGGGSFFLNANAIRVYSNTTTTGIGYRCGGFRFENIPVLQGKTIENAYLELFFADRQNINCAIYAENVDDSVDFQANQNIIDNAQRPKTENYSYWRDNGVGLNDWENSDNIATLLQEVIDRPGWTAGNAITLLLIANDDQTREASARTHDFNPANAARLIFHWQPTIENTEYPRLALPNSVIHVRQHLVSHGQEATSINAKLTFSDNNFIFLDNYPDNTAGMGTCGSMQCVHADWFMSVPNTPGTYTFFSEWGFVHEDAHDEVSDNFTIEVAAFTLPTVADPRMSENAYTLLLIIAYASLIAGLFARIEPKQRVVLLLLATLFLFLTAATSTLVNNQAVGLLNLGLGMLAAGLALVHSTEVMPRAGNP